MPQRRREQELGDGFDEGFYIILYNLKTLVEVCYICHFLFSFNRMSALDFLSYCRPYLPQYKNAKLRIEYI